MALGQINAPYARMTNDDEDEASGSMQRPPQLARLQLMRNPFEAPTDPAAATEAAHLRGEIAGLNPNDPNYLPKMNGLVSAHGAMEHHHPENPLLNNPFDPNDPYSLPRMGNEPQHRGALGKIGHVMARMGNIAGDVLAPGTMALIPGTDLYKEREAAIEEQRRLKEGQADTDRMRAGTERMRAETEQEEMPSMINWREAEARKDSQPKMLTPEQSTFQDLMTGDKGSPRINPNTKEPYDELGAWQAVKRAEQNRRFTSPFEAYAYGSPEERKSARDFISFEKQQGARYQRPSEMDQRYSLYKRDPQAYKDMFGDRGAAQNSRDQAQAARMLNYFAKQKKAIQEDFTLDDAEKQRQLAEIDQLEQPYLDVAQPSPQTQAGGRSNAGTHNAPQYKAGDEVSYKGQRMKVLNVLPNGKLELQPITAGAQ